MGIVKGREDDGGVENAGAGEGEGGVSGVQN